MSVFLELLYRALGADIGLSIETDDPILLQQRLYAARKKQADPQLSVLMIAPQPGKTQTHVWITNAKKQQETKDHHDQDVRGEPGDHPEILPGIQLPDDHAGKD